MLTSHEIEIRVRYQETDAQGRVHHANYLVYCEAARVDWLHKRGVSYQSWLQHGIHLPVVETRLRFKKAARFDELLDVTTTATELTRVTVRFAYRIRCADQLVCEAETMLACVGDDLKLKRLPAAVAEVFRSPEIVSV